MATDILQIVVYGVLLVALAVPLGVYMARVFDLERPLKVPVIGAVESLFYRVCAIDPAKGQHWTRYAAACVGLNLIGFLILYGILRLQDVLPLNPAGLGAASPHLAFNTAISFMTNTNWQAYGGESTLNYFSQMVGLTVQNFVSPAVGLAVLIAVIRGLTGRSVSTLGNFYVDLTRGVLYVLLPLSIVLALFLVWQGVPQNFDTYVDATTLEGAKQTIAQGPAASQIAIKQLGTNGGGFFSVNSAHPYENPTPLANLAEMLSILLIPAASVFMFGRMVKDTRQGRALFAAMAVMALVGLAIVYPAEKIGNPLLASVDAVQGNMEGKEVRFGVVNSALWAVATTGASNGSVNAMHDSLTPLGGLVPMVNMQTGEVVFGGVGAGLYGMLLFVVLTVFIAGLMVGRTPEYLGKKIEAREVTLSIIALLSMPLCILGFGGIAAVVPAGLASLANAGPHGLSEIIYAFSSATANNGSAFGGLSANTPFYNTMLGVSMFIGRFAFLIPMLAVGASLGAKKIVPESAGTFPTHGALFVGLLIAVIVIVEGLTFFPALALGPIADHLAMIAGQTF
jgi:K+-transporting ATPase ATPase A chain